MGNTKGAAERVKNYSSLQEYYKDNFPLKYYNFDKDELEIDPREDVADFDAYDEERITEEIIKCRDSFHYFCHKYVKISHPKEGLLPFITYKYQRHAVDCFESQRFNIIRKFRQGGLTTVSVIWALWRCIFKDSETIFFVSKTDREAIVAGQIAKRVMEELPEWLRPEMTKQNEHDNIFANSKCSLIFQTIEAVRGRSITYLIIDEAAFIEGMDRHWAALFPTINTGGSVIVISTVNGMGGIGAWYYETYKEAERGESLWNIINLSYTDHPDYNNPTWVKDTRTQLGEDNWKQEVLGDFLGSGSSFIPDTILNDLDEAVRNLVPERFLFEQFSNRSTKVKDTLSEQGALLVWKDPIEGRNYIMGVDAAEGVGKDGDNSCFQIIEEASCEQVAEFYSNSVPMHIFAQIVHSTASVYNHALVVIEDEKCGNTILSKLEHELFYDNLYYSEGKTNKAGIHTTKNTKPLFIECLQTRLLNRGIAVNSRRLVRELKNFIYNKLTKRVEKAKGHHDDAIMALCLALYVRESQGRFTPSNMLSQTPEEITEKFKIDIYEQIKAELTKEREFGNFEEAPFEIPIEDAEDDYKGNLPDFMQGKILRKKHTLLREFGWSIFYIILGGNLLYNIIC